MYKIYYKKEFLNQVKRLNSKTKQILKKKINLLETEPFRFKKIKHSKINSLFRIRFQNDNKKLRLIYQVEKNKIILICILNRKNNYKGLKNYFK